MTEDNKLTLQYEELKKRCRTMEGKNGTLQHKLRKARKNLRRLRLERAIDKHHHGADSDQSDSDLGLLLYDDLYPSFNHKQGRFTDKHMTTKAPKKKKDPNAPKGPGNVFFLFCRMERDKIKDENPQENIGDVTKLLGVKWKALSKEEKQVYYDTFKKEMEEYEEAMKTYKNNSNNSNNINNNDNNIGGEGIEANQSLDQMAESIPSSPYNDNNQQVELPFVQKYSQELDLNTDVHPSFQQEFRHSFDHSLPTISPEKQNSYV